jgi:hypothetical protein
MLSSFQEQTVVESTSDTGNSLASSIDPKQRLTPEQKYVIFLASNLTLYKVVLFNLSILYLSEHFQKKS